MKKTTILLLLGASFFLPPSRVYAASPTPIGEILNDIDPVNTPVRTPSGIINSLLPSVLTFAGLILFGMLIWGGFEMMTAGTDAKKADAGKTRITTAIIGFVIVFASYWITQILEVILGINIFK